VGEKVIRCDHMGKFVGARIAPSLGVTQEQACTARQRINAQD